MTINALLTSYETLMSQTNPSTLELYALADDLLNAAASWRTPAGVAHKLYAREREVRALIRNLDLAA